MDAVEVAQKVKSYISEKHVAESSEQPVSENTPLITGGILNSLSTLELVSFLEDTYDIEIAAHEVGVHNFNTIEAIARFVCSKA